MRDQIKLVDAVGKTLEGVSRFDWSNALLLSFSGDTFAYLKSKRGYENDVSLQETKLGILDYDEQEMLRLNICTRDEINEARKQRDDAREAVRAVAERCEYNRLKAIYEKEHS